MKCGGQKHCMHSSNEHAPASRTCTVRTSLNRAGKKISRRLTRCLSAPPSTGLSPGILSAPLPMAISSSMVASVSSTSLSASSGSPMVTPHHEAGLANISDAAGHRTAKTENRTKFAQTIHGPVYRPRGRPEAPMPSMYGIDGIDGIDDLIN